MSKGDDERRVIKNGQEKCHQIDRANDPKAMFEFKLRRGHRGEVNQELAEL
jgi:hypothetical protein